MMLTPRRSTSPLVLVARTAGSPLKVVGKLGRLAAVLSRYADRTGLNDRLERLHARGGIDVVPTGVQLVVGSIDMVRFWIVPASDDYYDQVGIDFRFHQLLRLLDEPASLADPVGLFSTEDGIITHLMQVVHANPVYDLQLLDLFEGGLDHLEQQIDQMIAGTHPRAVAIGSIVEEPDYHARLLHFVREWRNNPATPPLLRSNVAGNAAYSQLEKTFGSLPNVMRYFATMPMSLADGARHLLTVREYQPRT